MADFKDLTGQRFGRLVAIRRGEDYISPKGKHITRWVCKCDCGNETLSVRNGLLSGNLVSCGCIRREKAAARGDIVPGQKFCMLTVIERVSLPVARSNGVKTAYRCACDCGKETVVAGRDLRSGSIRSCGCFRDKLALDHIERDNTLGRYRGTVISAISPERPANKNSKSGIKGVYWSDRDQKWVAKIGFRGKTITIGRYASVGDAARAREFAESNLYRPIIDEFYNKPD